MSNDAACGRHGFDFHLTVLVCFKLGAFLVLSLLNQKGRPHLGVARRLGQARPVHHGHV